MVAALADRTEGPVVLRGLSVGGMPAVLAARAASDVRGVIVTTLLDMGDPAVFARAARWRWLGVASLRGLRWIPFVVDRLRLPLWLAAPMDKMSGHAAMRDYFTADPPLGRLRVPSRFFRTLHACKVGRIERRYALLLAHQGADVWTPTHLSLPAFGRVDNPKRLRESSNGTHLPLEQPARDELRQELTDFLASISER